MEIIQENIETVKLPEQADVIVSEWMGYFGVDENLLAPVLSARDRWLKPGGKMLPENVTARMAPIEDMELEKDIDFWRSHPYGADLSLMVYGEKYLGLNNMSADNFLAEPVDIWTHNIYTYPTDDARHAFQASLSFSAKRKGKLSALAVWFYADFDNEITLTNAPDSPDTHWSVVKFNMDRPIEVSPGSKIDVEFICEPDGCLHTRCKWSVRVGDGHWRHQDDGITGLSHI